MFWGLSLYFLLEHRITKLEEEYNRLIENHPALFTGYPFYHRDFKESKEVVLYHALHSKQVSVRCFDPHLQSYIEPESITLVDENLAVVGFTQPVTGYCEV